MEKIAYPKLTQKQIAEQIGLSKSTSKRYKKDMKTDSLNITKIGKTKKNCQRYFLIIFIVIAATVKIILILTILIFFNKTGLCLTKHHWIKFSVLVKRQNSKNQSKTTQKLLNI